MTKYIIPAVFIAVVVGLALFTTSSEYEVVNDREVVEIEKEVVPEWVKDEDAMKAAQGVIRKKELQAELEVLTTEVAEREDRITEIEKELGVF